ncbi:hypothetical protein L7F22_051675 [Adiantum nelumboides]|nr:hypothetical protein [Adiantum nelumboides]
MAFYRGNFLQVSEDGFVTRPRYMDTHLSHGLRCAIGQIRASSHQLEIEFGRFQGIPPEDRLCKLCGTEPETELHYICHCTVYYEIRGRFHCLFKEGFGPLDRVMKYEDQRIRGKSKSSSDRMKKEKKEKQVINSLCKDLSTVIPQAPSWIERMSWGNREDHDHENALRRNNALDFDDLMQLVVQLLHNNDYMREECQERWKYILVDEFQDTDMVQYELIRLLASTNKNLFVVGDIDQAIYGWRGAEFKHMQDSLEKDFPAIRTFQLRENYRSSSYIVKAASVVLSFSLYDRCIGSSRSLSLVPAVKETKAAPICIGEFNDPGSEAQFVVSEILNLVSNRKAVWGSFALLYRTRVQAIQLGPALSKAKIPYRIFGTTPFYADKEMKILLAYLQYVSNADNTFALDYCLNKPSRGIGEKTVEKIKEWARKKNLSFPQALEEIYVEPVTFKQLGIRSNAREGIMKFMELILDLRERSSKSSVVHLTRRLIDKLNFEAHLQATSQDEEQYEKHMERLQQFLVAAENAQALYGVGDKELSSFLEDITLLASNEETPGGDTARGKNEVKLLTLHASKGLEFDVVFLVGARDDLIPLEDADENEERRLFYVGITRARKQLYLTFNHGRLPWGDSKPEMSRFVKELKSSLPPQYLNLKNLSSTDFTKDILPYKKVSYF